MSEPAAMQSDASAKLRQLEAANIIKKMQKGHVPTARERETLDAVTGSAAKAEPGRRATVAELCGELEISDSAVRKHIAKAGLKADAKRRYDVAAVMSAVVKHRATDRRNQHGGAPSAREKKTETENEILTVKLQELRRQVVPAAEAAAAVRELAAIVAAGFAQAEAAVEALSKGDAQVVKGVREAFDAVRSEMSRQCREAAKAGKDDETA